MLDLKLLSDLLGKLFIIANLFDQRADLFAEPCLDLIWSCVSIFDRVVEDGGDNDIAISYPAEFPEGFRNSDGVIDIGGSYVILPPLIPMLICRES